MSRIEFSRKVRAAIIARANGKCEACNAVLKSGEGDVDHILPDALQGKPTAANGRWICKPCHKIKTADDIKRIRKSDRQRDKNSGAIKPEGRLKSPAFPGSGKDAKRVTRPSLPPRQLFREVTP